MPSGFAVMLRKTLARRGMSLAALARASGCRHGHLSMVSRDCRRPSYAMAGRWADSLGLSGGERERFLLLASVTHAPTEARPALDALVLRHGPRYSRPPVR